MQPPIIHGTTAEGFESVRAALACAAQAAGSDYAAQCCVYWRGLCVVDLWTGPQMKADTLLGAYSASKGAAHLVVARLVQDGALDLQQKVCHYWPAFAVEGKGELRLHELLAHRAGLVGSDQGFSLDELADDRIVAERLAAQRPFWRPGAAFGYHALVMGALSGEVVRRATGQSIQSLFDTWFKRGAEVDFHLGLSDVDEDRFLPTLPITMPPDRKPATASPCSLTDIAFNRHHPQSPAVWELPNYPQVRRLGAASLGGVASARGLARMYAVATMAVDGQEPLLDPRTQACFGQIQSAGHDLVLGNYKAFTSGFHATSSYYPLLGAGTFGHSGAGGQQAFADPRHAIAYGFTRRRPPFPAAAAPENDRLLDALYQSIGKVRP